MLRKRYPAPPDFVSDGCTVPSIVRPLFNRYKEACRWHDWARRHLVHHGLLTVKEADWEFRAYMGELGAPSWMQSITWVAVKLMRNRYSRTFPVPSRWSRFLLPTYK